MLVTGAGGFIGSHLAERLVREGAKVTAFLRYTSSANRGWLEASPHAGDIRFHHGDIGDADSVALAVEGQDFVFHLGAMIAIPYSYEAPRDYVRVNIEGTTNVLQAARRLGGVPVVCTSTSEVYGTALRAPIDETHPLQGQSPYSASKIGADKIAESFALSFNQPVVICRPFNTYGPRQSTRAVIPTIISQLLQSNRVKLGSLSPTRDLNFVDDTVEGFLACARAPAMTGQAYNFGSGREISIGGLVELIAGVIGVTPEVICDDDRLRPEKSEVMRLLADSTLAKSELGWTNQVDLETGLARTVEWVRQNAGHYRAGEYHR